MRARLFDWRTLLSIGAGATMVAPVAYWLITERHNLVALYQANIAPMAATNWVKAIAVGLGKAIWVPLAFLFPLDVIVPVFSPAALRQGWAAIKEGVNPRVWDQGQPDWRLLLLHITLGGFLVLMLGAVLTGATHILERYMHPFFLLTPLWLLGLVESSGNASRKLTALAVVLVTAIVVVVPLRVRDTLHSMGPDCVKCRIAVPYDGLAAALTARGFHAGTIIAADRQDAGNLRRMFPEARIVRLERPRYVPPLCADAVPKVAVVWRRIASPGRRSASLSQFWVASLQRRSACAFPGGPIRQHRRSASRHGWSSSPIPRRRNSAAALSTLRRPGDFAALVSGQAAKVQRARL